MKAVWHPKSEFIVLAYSPIRTLISPLPYTSLSHLLILLSSHLKYGQIHLGMLFS